MLSALNCFRHTIYFPFRTFLCGDFPFSCYICFMSTVALIIEVTARDVSRYYTQSNTYSARQSAQKLVGERQGNERIDITKKWHTVSLRRNHSVKTDRWFRAKNRRNCKRLPIVLKGNRSFTTSYLKTPLVLFDLFLPFACIGFVFFYLTFTMRYIGLSHVKCRFYDQWSSENFR